MLRLDWLRGDQCCCWMMMMMMVIMMLDYVMWFGILTVLERRTYCIDSVSAGWF